MLQFSYSGKWEKEEKIPLDPLWCNSTYMQASAVERMWQEWWKGNQMTLRMEDWQLEWNEHLVGSTETVMAMLVSYRRAWQPPNILLHSLCREISNATKFSWSNLWKVFKPRRKTSKNESNNGAPTQSGVKVFLAASTSEGRQRCKLCFYLSLKPSENSPSFYTSVNSGINMLSV